MMAGRAKDFNFVQGGALSLQCLEFRKAKSSIYKIEKYTLHTYFKLDKAGTQL